MLWLRTSGLAPSTVASASSSTPRKSGIRTSTVESGSFALERTDRCREMAGAAVGQVVAVDGGHTTWLSPIVAAACARRQRLERVGRVLGLPELT